MRDNEKRHGAGAEPAPVVEKEEKAVSFNFAVPTQFVELPSRGRFYPEGSPLKDRESLEIRFMTAKEEDILTSRTLIKQGLAIDRMLQNLIVDKSVNVNELLVGDKNALIVAARITGYGSEYSPTVTCPVCNTSKKHEFDLDDKKVLSGGLSEELDGVEQVDTDKFSLQLPASKYTVVVRLLTGADETKLANAVKQRKKRNLPEAGTTDQFRLFIVSVEGSNKDMDIAQFAESMPLADAKYLKKVYKQLVPNVDLTQTFVCNTCDEETEMEVPFTTEFFWPE